MERKDYYEQLSNIRNEIIEDIKRELGNRDLTHLAIGKWTDNCDYYNGSEEFDEYDNIVGRIVTNAVDSDGFYTIPCDIIDVIIKDDKLQFEVSDVYSGAEYKMFIEDISTIELLCVLNTMYTLFETHDKNEIKLY